MEIHNGDEMLTVLMTGCLPKSTIGNSAVSKTNSVVSITNFISMLGGSISQGQIYVNPKHRLAESLLSTFFLYSILSQVKSLGKSYGIQNVAL